MCDTAVQGRPFVSGQCSQGGHCHGPALDYFCELFEITSRKNVLGVAAGHWDL